MSYTVNLKDSSGKAYVTGLYTATGTTGILITTGLGSVEYFGHQPNSGTPTPGITTLNFGTPGSVLVTGFTSGQSGCWHAIGV